jgi:predicted transcriptional regulator
MAALNLQHKKLKSYLELLAAANLIEYQKRKRTIVISTTDKGVDAVRAYRSAIALLTGNYLTRPTDARMNERQNSQSIPA